MLRDHVLTDHGVCLQFAGTEAGFAAEWIVHGEHQGLASVLSNPVRAGTVLPRFVIVPSVAELEKCISEQFGSRDVPGWGGKACTAWIYATELEVSYSFIASFITRFVNSPSQLTVLHLITSAYKITILIS